jgi:ankyrin repeat protein
MTMRLQSALLPLLMTVTLSAGAGAGAAAPEPEVVVAAKAGDTAAVRALVRRKADVNAREADGTTALHWAVRIGAQPTVDLLLEAGADVNAVNRYGVTPLSVAAQAGNAVMLETLLRSGARLRDAEARLPEGQTLLMHAARVGDVAAVAVLLAAGSAVDARETRTGTTAIMWAATADRAAVVRQLAEAGATLDVVSKITDYPHTQNGVGLTGIEEGVSYVGQTVLPRGGWSAAMFAAREGAVGAVRSLADAGANLNLVDPEGTSALVIAVINGHYDVVAALLEKGADPNVADIKGMTPLYAAVDMHTLPTTFGRPDPPLPVIEGSIDAIKALLAAGADPNARLKDAILKRVYNPGDARLAEGATPFMRAARGADAAVMRLLLEGGADPTLTQKNGNSPLMLTASAGSGRASDNNPDRVTEPQAIEALRFVIGLGVDLNQANASGDTVMHVAATTNLGSPAIIQFLFDKGARVDVKNTAGRTPLDAVLRAREKSEDTIALLKRLSGVEAPPGAAAPAATVN